MTLKEKLKEFLDAYTTYDGVLYYTIIYDDAKFPILVNGTIEIVDFRFSGTADFQARYNYQKKARYQDYRTIEGVYLDAIYTSESEALAVWKKEKQRYKKLILSKL